MFLYGIIKLEYFLSDILFFVDKDEEFHISTSFAT